MTQQCKDIDAALARLENAINQLNGRFSNLENRISRLEQGLNSLNSIINGLQNADSDIRNKLGNLDGELKKLKQGGEKNNNESEILKRLSKLESYCGSVEQYLSGITHLVSAMKRFFT